MRWERLQVQAKHGEGGQETCSGPGKRWGHTCNAIRGGKLLYVFGGYGKDNCQSNQVHVFDTVMRRWCEPVMKGALPTPRDSHTCTTVGDNLFVFGGTDGKNPLKDLHILDTASNTWILPYVRGEGPEAREGHSAALVGKRLFIFGGCGKSSNGPVEEYYDDLYILNTETMVWKRVATSGSPPAKRDSHTCSSWKNKIIVIGGEDTDNYYLSDVHVLDTDTLLWGKLNTSGHPLSPRAGHTTVALGKYLFVFGGFTDEQNLYDDIYMLDLGTSHNIVRDTCVWTKVITTGEGPSARFSMAGDSLDPQQGGVLVFIGGCNKSLEALDDMFYLFTGLSSETERDERRLEKLSLRKQLKLKCQEQHIVAPVYDRALVRVETNANSHQPMHVPTHIQPIAGRQNVYLNEYQTPLGKKTFQARVTRSLTDGYTIETVIDGKPLRGVLFSNKPSSTKIADDDSIRKKGSVEDGDPKPSDDQNPRSETAKSLDQGVISNHQVDGVHEKQSVLPEAMMQTVAASEIKNPAISDVSRSFEAPGDSVVFNGNLEKDQTSDALHFTTSITEENRAAAAKDSSTSLLNQDGRALTTEEQNLLKKNPPAQTV